MTCKAAGKGKMTNGWVERSMTACIVTMNYFSMFSCRNIEDYYFVRAQYLNEKEELITMVTKAREPQQGHQR